MKDGISSVVGLPFNLPFPVFMLYIPSVDIQLLCRILQVRTLSQYLFINKCIKAI